MGATTTTENGPSGPGGPDGPGGSPSGPRLPPRVHRAPPPGRKRGHQTSPRERQLIVVVAAAAGVAGAFSTVSPTNYLVSDVIIRAALAALIALASSRARRWTWLVLAGLSIVGAPSGVWFAVAGVGLLIAFVTTIFPRRRIYGALVGATAAQGLLRFTDVAYGRGSLVLFAVAVVPVFASAYAVAPRRVRKRIHYAALGVAAFVVVATVLFGVATLLAYNTTQSATKQARAGLRSVRDGRSDEAGAQLREASASFRSANGLVDAWWVRPAGAVPFLAQQARAVQVVTAEGATMTSVAAGTASQADIQQLKYEDGRVDVQRLASLSEPLTATADSFSTAAHRIEQVRSPWLVPQLASSVDEVDRELNDTLPQLQLAADAARNGPALLGATGPRRYLILFTQPAESRGLGGFVSNWAELTAVDGRLELGRSGRVDELNKAPGDCNARKLTSPPVPRDYVERYDGRFHPGCFFQDVTLSPDLPSVAAAAAQLFPEMGGAPVDGVLAVDPYALAALLTFTGPLRIEGFDQALTSENAADLLIKEQYERFDTNEERKDFLDEASRRTFEELVSGSLPSPKRLAEVLGPVVQQRRLMFTSFDPAGDALAARLALNGAFPEPDGHDFFQLVTQNKANNKIDPYLRRDIEYEARYNASTGDVEAKMLITLHNDAPSSGLPDAIIGSNDQGLPLGTNVVYLSLYTPLGLRTAKDATHAVPLEFQRELGYSVYSAYVEIPSGGTATLELELFGQLDAGPEYRLRVGAQPTVNRDRVTVRVRTHSDWEIVRTTEMNIDPSRSAAAVSLNPSAMVTLSATMVRS